jgi:hypothetical protein
MFEHFTPTHIPTLFVASALTFGGMLPLVYPQAAIREMGFPARIHTSPAAQTIMTLGMGRTTVIGMALWTFYLKEKLEEVDTLLLILGSYLGAIDAWVCWNEGLSGKAWFRGLSGILIAGWGWIGMTARV